MEDVSSWLLEDWNWTDRGDFGSRCRVDIWMMMSGCRVVGSRCRTSGWWWGIIMRMMRNSGWMDGFLSRGSMWSSSDLLFFFCESRLCSFCRANISDVRCPASSCCITLEIVMNPKGKMFCITTVEFLMKIVKKCFFFRRAFDSQHNLLILVASCSAVFCRVVLRFFPDRLVLRWISDRSPSMHRAWILVSVLFESVRLFSRIVFIAVSIAGFFQPSVIGYVGPYCGPSGVAATVRVDARFQGTIVRGLGYPICRPSPCGPRRQFDIGDSCVCSNKQLQLFGSCI